MEGSVKTRASANSPCLHYCVCSCLGIAHRVCGANSTPPGSSGREAAKRTVEQEEEEQAEKVEPFFVVPIRNGGALVGAFQLYHDSLLRPSHGCRLHTIIIHADCFLLYCDIYGLKQLFSGHYCRWPSSKPVFFCNGLYEEQQGTAKFVP